MPRSSRIDPAFLQSALIYEGAIVRCAARSATAQEARLWCTALQKRKEEAAPKLCKITGWTQRRGMTVPVVEYVRPDTIPKGMEPGLLCARTQTLTHARAHAQTHARAPTRTRSMRSSRSWAARRRAARVGPACEDLARADAAHEPAHRRKREEAGALRRTVMQRGVLCCSVVCAVVMFCCTFVHVCAGAYVCLCAH
jgi:hypothetical protein